MSLQPLLFLLLFGGIQGVLFTVFLLRRKLHRHGYIFLLCYIAVLLLQLTLKVMSKYWLMENWPVFYSLAHFLPLLYGPFLLLFVNDILHQRQSITKSLMHFLPFLAFFFILTVAETITVPSAVEMILYDPYFRMLMLMTSVGWYHRLAVRAWKGNTQDNKNSHPAAIDKTWIPQFIWISLIVSSIIVMALFLLYINYPAGHGYRYGFVALTLFIYWITYAALKQPVLFIIPVAGDNVQPNKLAALFVHRGMKKYARSTLDATEKERITKALQQLMEHDKLYLDPSLTIDHLAEKAGSTRHALSQVLNECIGKSFYDYVNHYRVEEAKALLLSPIGKQYKISSIAYDAGFNSLSTFNEVFRKLTGCTPSQFTKELKVRQRV